MIGLIKKYGLLLPVPVKLLHFSPAFLLFSSQPSNDCEELNGLLSLIEIFKENYLI